VPLPVASSDLRNYPLSSEPEPWQDFRRQDMELHMLSRLNAARTAVAERMRPFLRKYEISEIVGPPHDPRSPPRLARNAPQLHGHSDRHVEQAIQWLLDNELIKKFYARRNGAPKQKRSLYGEGRSIVRKFHFQLELTRGGEHVCLEGLTDASTRYLDVEQKFSEDDLVELYGLRRRFTEALTGVSWESTQRVHDPYAKKTARIVEIAKTWPRGKDGKILPRSGIPRPPKRKPLTKRDLDRLAGFDYPRRSHHKKKPKTDELPNGQDE
jgi:hypothetical protein